MNIVNRSAITVLFRKPFIDWHNGLMPDMHLDQNMLRESVTYLIADLSGDIDKVLRKHYKEIFENELFQMWEDENDWPVKLSYKLFNEWFSVEVSGFVFDICKNRLEGSNID